MMRRAAKLPRFDTGVAPAAAYSSPLRDNAPLPAAPTRRFLCQSRFLSLGWMVTTWWLKPSIRTLRFMLMSMTHVYVRMDELMPCRHTILKL